MIESPEPLQFGNYEVIQRSDGSHWLLGEGGYGRTYKARHRFLRRICALKLIHERHTRDEQQRGRFLQEARTAASLSHPGIAQVFDFGETDGAAFYVMEFCEGGSLDEYSERRGPIPWTEVAPLARQMAAALACAHGGGLLHRDLKPQNVMLASTSAPPVLKLIDFGLVKVIEPDASDSSFAMVSRDGGFKGNYATASPEQTGESDDLDERSDLFSLGVILWWLLLGKSPFSGLSHPLLIADRLSNESYAPQLAGLDPTARAILAKLLEKEPVNRFASAHELLAALPVTTDEAAASAAPQAAETFEESFEVVSVLDELQAAKLYHCRDGEGRSYSALVPGDNAAQASVEALANVSRERRNLGCYTCLGEWPTESGQTAFVFGGMDRTRLLDALKTLGGAKLSELIPLLNHLARSIDQCAETSGPSPELNPHLLRIGDAGPSDTPASWASLKPGSLRAVPRILADGGRSEFVAESTIVSNDAEFPVTAQFANLVYRLVSGIALKHAAYFTADAYVPTAALSEDGNRLLAGIISGNKADQTTTDLLRELARTEGISVSRNPGTLDPAVDPPPVSLSTSTIASPRPSSPATQPAAPTRADPGPESPPSDSAPPTAPRRSMTKPVAIIAAAAAAIVLLAWPLRTILSRDSDDGSPPITKAEVNDPITVDFPQLTLNETRIPADARLVLCDSSGETVTTLALADSSATAAEVPGDLFNQASSWPMCIRFDSNALAMTPLSLARDDFSSSGETSQRCSRNLHLEPKPFALFKPVIEMAGETIALPVTSIKRHLHPADPAVDWTLEDQDGALAVTLAVAPDHGFPLPAVFAPPGLAQVSFEFTPGQQPLWKIQLEQRTLTLSNLGNFRQLRFLPDYDGIDDPELREIVARIVGTPSAGPADLEDATWTLPAVGGTVEVTGAGKPWSFQLPATIEFKVLSAAERSGKPAPEGDAEFRATLKHAEHGNIDAQYGIGLMFHQGKNVALDEEVSTAWFGIAAARGDKTAQFNLGLAYEIGRGIPADDYMAAKWFSKAAAQMLPDAQTNLGLCYQQGRGVPLNVDLAEQWFLKAVNQGHPGAMYNLAFLYGEKEFGKFDEAKAVELYQQAADRDHAMAQFNLAWYYRAGTGGLETDLRMARDLYRKSEENGYPKARESLESMLKRHPELR